VVTPHDADLSPRKAAGFLLAPQYALTSTSPASQVAWQDSNRQFTRTTLISEDSPGGPEGPGGPRRPVNP
jgi:hypothetical protein